MTGTRPQVTYERSAILEWLQRCDASPLTGAPLANKLLNANHAVKGAVLMELSGRGLLPR